MKPYEGVQPDEEFGSTYYGPTTPDEAYAGWSRSVWMRWMHPNLAADDPRRCPAASDFTEERCILWLGHKDPIHDFGVLPPSAPPGLDVER